MQDFWNARYATQVYTYGKEPNRFLKDSLPSNSRGKILLPAEGEGRNAVFASKMGYRVTAFDSSSNGMIKALKLALENNVKITYRVASYDSIECEQNYFDVLALIFAHMQPSKRQFYHQKLLSFLKPGGLLILQGFSKEQINYSSGGPKDIDMLFSPEELQFDFAEMKNLVINSQRTFLSEGDFHKGEAAVVSVIGNK